MNIEKLLVLFLVTIVVSMAFIWFFPSYRMKRAKLQKDDTPISVENDLRRTWIQALGGLLVIASIMFTGYQFQITEIRSQNAQWTDRFSQAVHQLNMNSPTAQTGGIYALYQIADESPEKSLSSGFSLLISYLRDGNESNKRGTIAVGALNLLRQKFRPNESIGLTRAKLQNADFRGADLRNFDLRWAVLTNANLSEANLENVDLCRTNLVGADLRETNLTGASLSRCVLMGIRLWETAKWNKTNIYEVRALGGNQPELNDTITWLENFKKELRAKHSLVIDEKTDCKLYQ